MPRSHTSRTLSMAPVRSHTSRTLSLAPVRSHTSRTLSLAPVRSHTSRTLSMAPVRSRAPRARSLWRQCALTPRARSLWRQCALTHLARALDGACEGGEVLAGRPHMERHAHDVEAQGVRHIQQLRSVGHICDTEKAGGYSLKLGARGMPLSLQSLCAWVSQQK